MVNSFCTDDHSQRNNFHTPPVLRNSSELTLGTTYSSQDRSSSVIAATSPPQSRSPNNSSFHPKNVVKGQLYLEQRNSIVSPSITKPSKQPRKRRRSSVEQSNPVVISSKANDVLVSPIPVDGIKDMPQPFVSLTDMNFHHLGTIPTTVISTLHQPLPNHQMQDVRNCFSGNAFDNEHHPTQQYNKESHRTVSSEDNLNSVINKVCIQQ